MMQLQFQFDSLADFFAMGNYGFYVWLSYGISFVAMGWLIWQSKREQKQIVDQVKKELVHEALANK
jgi:heme exporter protein ccmD